MKTFFAIFLIFSSVLISQGQDSYEPEVRGCVFPSIELLVTKQSRKRKLRQKSRNYIIIPNKKPVHVRTRRFMIVKALAGDTVATIAQRYGANPVDVANLNAFTSLSFKLAAGRGVKIPLKDTDQTVSPRPQDRFIFPQKKSPGAKPAQFGDGKAQAVMFYSRDNFDDPGSVS